MSELDKQKETVHNAINTLFDIAKVQKAEIDLLNVDIANKQSEINELKAKLEAAKVPEGFVLVPKEPTEEIINAMHDSFLGSFIEGKATGGQSIEFAYKAMIEAAQGEEE